MAELLKHAQPASALAGLLVVTAGTLCGDDVLLVAKVEHQDAMRIEPEENDEGHRIFKMEHIRDLVFGDNAKVYKVGIVFRAASAGGVLSGEIVDDQNRGRHAAYFLRQFMGMRLREEPNVLTENFFDRLTTVINGSSMTPEEKVTVQTALLTQLSSNATTISPQAFIRDYVPPGHQVELAHASRASAVPMTEFPLDTSRIAPRLRKLRIDYSMGIHLVVPADAVGPGKPVQIHEAAEGDSITIDGGRLVKVQGNGSR